MGCGKRYQPDQVVNLLPKIEDVHRQHPSHDLEARFALLLVDRSGVNIKRCATARMSHQFLSNLDVNTERSQVGRN